VKECSTCQLHSNKHLDVKTCWKSTHSYVGNILDLHMKNQGYICSQAQSEKHEKSQGLLVSHHKSALLRWLVISISLQRSGWTKWHNFQTFQFSPAKCHCTNAPHLSIINGWYNRFFWAHTPRKLFHFTPKVSENQLLINNI
jgi:hypothetical protein